ncbi:MAG: diguanylate cyclase [Candidatus Omnitrophota bacterium]
MIEKNEKKVFSDQNKYLECVMNSMADALIVVNFDMTVRLVNKATLDLLGYQESELIGQPLKSIFLQEDEEEALDKYFKKIINSGVAATIELTFINKQRKEISVNFSGAAIREDGKIVGLVGVARDMRKIIATLNELEEKKHDLEKRGKELAWPQKTILDMVEDLNIARKEAKKAEEEIKDIAYKFQTVVESVGEGITFSDKSGKFSVYNPKMKELTGYTAEEANNCGDFTKLLYPRPLEHQKALQRLQEIIEHKVTLPLEVETTIQTKGGKNKVLWVSTIEMKFKDREMFLSVYRDITERKRLEEKLEALASRDELTNCYNFRSTMDFLEKEIARSCRYQTSFTIIMVDIDDFKKLNDNYGHLVGNDALVIFSNVLKSSFRNIDTVCRYGGEEFIIILPETDAQYALVALERVKSNLALTKIISLHLNSTEVLTLKFSAGIVSFPQNASELKELIWAVDNAMRQAKQEGKNRAVFEKRRSVRFSPVSAVKIEIADFLGKEKVQDQKIINISKEGALFLFSRDFSNEEFLCRLWFSKNNSLFEVACKVKHKNRLDAGLYRVGVHFENVTGDTKASLLNCIESTQESNCPTNLVAPSN